MPIKPNFALFTIICLYFNIDLEAQGSADQYKYSPSNPGGTRYSNFSPAPKPYTPSTTVTKPRDNNSYTPKPAASGVVFPGPANGYGLCKYTDGTLYAGYFKDYLRSGTGSLSRKGVNTSGTSEEPKDEKIYVGEWLEDSYHGKGVLTIGGDKYEGNFASGRKNGFGIFTGKDGQRYEGNWKADLKDGTGKLYDKAGNIIQEGTWEMGVHLDVIRHEMPDGSKYYGQVTNGKKTGYGVLKLVSGDKYEGDFLNDLANGNGTYTSKGGGVYKGEFKDNKKDGQGIYNSIDYTYEGSFKNDHRDGYGKLISKDGTKYTGDFKNDKCEGTGTLANVKGEKWSGEWINEMLNGEGAFEGVDGSKYSGRYKDGVPNGKGKWTYPDGSTKEGDWKNGKLDGHGIFIRKDGIKYDGEWKEDLRSGYGVYEDVVGKEKYTGQWWYDRPGGAGVYLYPDGTKYEGNLSWGKRDGTGTLYDAAGIIQKQGTWHEDSIIDLNIHALQDIKRVLESASQRFSDTKGKLIRTDKYKYSKSVKYYNTLLKISGGTNGMVREAEIAEVADSFLRYSEEISFKTEGERNVYAEELKVILPPRLDDSWGALKMPAYPGVTLDFSMDSTSNQFSAVLGYGRSSVTIIIKYSIPKKIKRP